MRNTSGPGCRDEKVTDDFSAPRRVGVSEDSKEQPEWLIRELLKQNRRRHTVTLGDKAQTVRRQLRSIDPTRSLCSLKVSFSKHLSESEIRCDPSELISASEKVVLNLDYDTFPLIPNESTAAAPSLKVSLERYIAALAGFHSYQRA